MFNLRSLFVNKKTLYKTFRPMVLVVLDGFGIAPPSGGNAIAQAKKPNLDFLYKTYPSSELIASGESVGLPANEVGNSEVGHLTIGAGRVILQELERINVSIRDGSFYDNKGLFQLSSHLNTHSSNLHIMGLVSSGNVHSSMDHLFAILEYCKRRETKNVFIHVFLDGRDAAPTDGINAVQKLAKYIDDNKIGKIATIAGRYYAMDRDRRWDRTEKAYKAIVLGEGPKASDPLVALKSYYANNITDEFVTPTVIVQNSAEVPGENSGSPIVTINDNDGVIFFNFRGDRAIQLTLSFTYKDFENLKSFHFGHQPGAAKQQDEVRFAGTFKRTRVPQNLFFVSMTQYHKDIPVNALCFAPPSVTKTLSEVLSARGLRQLHLAESEKEKMVTYYFDGLREEPFFGEDINIVSSSNVTTYDKNPEMSASKILSEFKNNLYKGTYNFFVINFANPDMVAHSGNIEKTIVGIETVDKVLGQIYKEVIGLNGTLVITADHGNAEEMQSFKNATFFYTSQTGSVNTEHSNNPVPFLLIDKNMIGRKLMRGSLEDVATTVLELMRIPKPVEMTGKNLLVSIEPQKQNV